MTPNIPDDSGIFPTDTGGGAIDDSGLSSEDPDDFAIADLFAQALGSGDESLWIPPSVEDLQRILPSYKIEVLLGCGGMGAVYRAAQPALGRSVAIKLLNPELGRDMKFAVRFEREARTLAGLDHPGIVHVHDFGRSAEGHLYFVMEFVDGCDLHRMIQNGGPAPSETLDLISQVCDALQFAHSKGVVHRDVKPSNILVNREGRAKLADFGLARPLEAGKGQLTLTRAIMGTPDYMAPEQKRGEGDHRVDLYALGVMLYEMLCGRPPQGAWQAPSLRVRVDARLDQVVIKAMQEEPECRYQQASEVKTDVETIRLTSVGAVPPRSAESHRRLRPFVIGCFVAAAVGMGLWFFSTGKTERAVLPVQPPSPPTVHLRFDETEGTIATDSSGRGQNGSLVGNMAFCEGKIDNAVIFNGNSQYVRLPDGVAAHCDDFTAAAWVKPGRASAWTRIFDFGSGSNSYMFLSPWNDMTGTPRFAITVGGTSGEQRIDGNAVLQGGRWIHLTVTLSGTKGTLYVDAVPVGTNPGMSLRPSLLGVTPKNYLGRSQFPSDPNFQGLMDDFRIYDRALTAEEVAEVAGIVPAPQLASAASETGAGGMVDPGWKPAANGEVISMAIQADGKILAGGKFSAIDGSPCGGLARLNVDGTLDEGFRPRVDGEVVDILVQPDGRIVIGGIFAQVGGEVRRGLARLNVDGSLDSGFHLNADCFVYGLTPQADGKLLVAGGFKKIGDVTMNGLARLDENGMLDVTFPNPEFGNTVACTTVQHDGKIVAVGNFTTVGGTPRNRIARFDRNGALDPSFDPDANGWVYAIASRPDGTLLVGGTFSSVGGKPHASLARLDPNGMVHPDFRPPIAGAVLGITLQADGKALVHGALEDPADRSRRALMRVADDGTIDRYPTAVFDGEVRSAVLQSDGRVLLGGVFGTIDGVRRGRLARMLNDTVAVKELTTPARDSILWSRTGSAPETTSAEFHVSVDGEASWTPLGPAVRLPNGWSVYVPEGLPSRGSIRARARTRGGNFHGSSGIVEQRVSFSFASE